jgi:hypothetical protein
LIARELDCAPQTIQFLEKHHIVYMTRKERGIAKAPRPPLFKKLEIKRVGPKIKSKGWFNLESYQRP